MTLNTKRIVGGVDMERVISYIPEGHEIIDKFRQATTLHKAAVILNQYPEIIDILIDSIPDGDEDEG